MKRLLALLLLLTVLTGCGLHTPPTETTLPAGSTAAATEATATVPPTTEPEKSLLDGAEPWKGDENLLDLHVEQLENCYYDQIFLTGDRLIAVITNYEEPEGDMVDGGTPIVGMTCKSIDLATGELVCERSVRTSNYLLPQIVGEEVAVCDNLTGRIEIYDRDLSLLRRYEATPDDGQWLFGRRDGRDVIYRFRYGSDAMVEDLQTGAQEIFSRRHPELWPGINRQGRIGIPVLDQDTGLTERIVLDLATGEQIPSPMDAGLHNLVKVGDDWLGILPGTSSDYLFRHDGETLLAAVGDEQLMLLDDGRLFLSDGYDVRLYDTDGRLLDICEPAVTDQGWWFWEILWSDRYGGYFMVLDDTEFQRHLLLWQPETTPQEGDELLLVPYAPPEDIPAAGAVAQEYHDRAAEMGEKYGIEIRIDDRDAATYSSFQAEPLEDAYDFPWVLDLVERCLDQYPENFLRQLRWGETRRMQIRLTGALHADEDIYDPSTEYAAFVYLENDWVAVVCNVGTMDETVLAHELSHIIDRKLEWDAQTREDALYSEELWASHNPEGFVYQNSYGNFEYEFEDPALRDYFISPYSTTYATEDRATLMETAMTDPWQIGQAPGLQAKLRYYSDCIRDCFDTTGWPEVTAWEQALLS